MKEDTLKKIEIKQLLSEIEENQMMKLSGTEIIAIRNHFGETQKSFSKKLDISINTIIALEAKCRNTKTARICSQKTYTKIRNYIIKNNIEKDTAIRTKDLDKLILKKAIISRLYINSKDSEIIADYMIELLDTFTIHAPEPNEQSHRKRYWYSICEQIKDLANQAEITKKEILASASTELQSTITDLKHPQKSVSQNQQLSFDFCK